MDKIKQLFQSCKWWIVACIVCLALGAVLDRAFSKSGAVIQERVVEKVVEKVVERVVEVEKKTEKHDSKIVVEKGPSKTTSKKFKDGQITEEVVVEEGSTKIIEEKKIETVADKRKESEKESERLSEKSSEKTVTTKALATWSLGVAIPAKTFTEKTFKGLTLEGGYRVVGPAWVTLSATNNSFKLPAVGVGLRVEF